MHTRIIYPHIVTSSIREKFVFSLNTATYRLNVTLNKILSSLRTFFEKVSLQLLTESYIFGHFMSRTKKKKKKQ